MNIKELKLNVKNYMLFIYDRNSEFESKDGVVYNRSKDYFEVRKELWLKVKNCIDLKNDNECLVVSYLVYSLYENDVNEFDNILNDVEVEVKDFRNWLFNNLKNEIYDDLNDDEINDIINDDLNNVRSEMFGFEVNG